MKLVIDCFKLVKGAGKSIGIYNLACHLVQELAKGNHRTENEIIVFGNAYNRPDFGVKGIHFIEIKKNPLDKKTCVLWELFQVSVLAKKLGVDKVLFPRGYTSLLHLTKEYVIIHDMIPFYYRKHFPKYFNPLENFYICWRLKASARKADKVITISEASKQDIMKYAQIEDKRITVIYNGYNPIVEGDYKQTDKRYLAAMTSELPHKNAAYILESYTAYHGAVENPLPLMIIGLKDLSKYQLPQNIEADITCISYLEKDEDLYRLIGGAAVFLFLSLIEGFGFPPIEAMQLGTPVICSNTSSLPEVVGEGAVCVSVTDCNQVSKAIIDIVSHKIDVAALCRKGKANAERFNWEKTGKKYREVLFE